jgi:hypothetical protein
LISRKNDTRHSAKPPAARLILGGAIFISGFLSPLLTPLVVTSSLPTTWKTAISGLLVFGIPELFMVIAVAVLGKEGYNYLKSKLFAILKKAAPPDEVSQIRYHIGLFLFLLPIFVGWLLPYFTSLIPHYEEYRMIINVSGDLMLLISFFVLGGDFWDKLRGLFVHKAKIIMETG